METTIGNKIVNVPGIGNILVQPYQVKDRHWEYTLVLDDDREWDSIECDNGVVSQQAHNSEEALAMGVTTAEYMKPEEVDEWFAQ